MKKAKSDLITSVILAILCVIYFALSFQIRQIGLISITSAFIPQICAICLFLLSVAMFVRSMNLIRSGQALGGEQSQQEKADGRAKILAAVVAFVLLAIGILLMDHVGFVVGMAFYLMTSFISLSKFYKKNWIVFAVMAVGVPVVVYLLFTRGFNLRLPAGIFDIGGGIL